MKKVFAVILALVVLCAALAACGSGAKDPTGEPAQSEPAQGEPAGNEGNDAPAVQPMPDRETMINANRHVVVQNRYNVFALKADGTVIWAGKELDDMWSEIGTWTNIISLAVDDFHILGLREDGTVVAAGSHANGICDVSDWTDIVGVAASGTGSFGLKADGTAVSTEAILMNDPDYLFGMTNAVQLVAAQDAHGFIVRFADGTCKYGGSVQYSASDWTDIVDVGVEREYVFGLKADGTILGGNLPASFQDETYRWKDIVKLADYGCEMALRKDGGVEIFNVTPELKEIIDAWTDIAAISWRDYIIGVKTDGTAVAVAESYRDQSIAETVSGWSGLMLPR